MKETEAFNKTYIEGNKYRMETLKIFGVVLIGFIIVGSLLWLQQKESIYVDFRKENARLTYEKCCDGFVCSDTFYDIEKDKCILTNCFTLFNKKCEYDPI